MFDDKNKRLKNYRMERDKFPGERKEKKKKKKKIKKPK